MPTVSIKKNVICEKLGKQFTDEEFDELCFEYGLELDEVTSEQEIVGREQGMDKAKQCSDEVIYKIDVPANRYDLLCVEGLVRGLMIFNQKISTPRYVKSKPKSLLQMFVTLATSSVRPFAVGAVLRNVTLSPASYASFIDLQDKLHQNICRKRSLVAIGTHDLDTIEAPFKYDAQAPGDIKFRALNQADEHTAVELMDIYSVDSHLKAYLPIIRDKPLYPIIRDKNNVVLSMPPIINGEHSKIRLETRNIFIECTATDLNKASIVLDTVVTMFSEYCQTPFEVEPVEIVYEDGRRLEYPDLLTRQETVSCEYINGLIGVDLKGEEMAKLLTRMSLTSHVQGSDLMVNIPPTRHDILQQCDIAEDVGVAYGYNKIVECVPSTNCVAYDQPVNKLTDCLRNEVAYAGFSECLTFSLCSREDISERLRKDLNSLPAVHIGNPKALEFQVVRTSLVPGVLRTLSSNRNLPLPLKIFEIQDVVLRDNNKDVGARNERRLCAVYCSKTGGFEVIHGLLDRVMQVLGVPQQDSKAQRSYRIEAVEDSMFFPGRCAQVLLSPGNVSIGHLGILHPEVIENFDLHMPCALMEINIEPFV